MDIEDVLTCSVGTFTKVYRSLKRVETLHILRLSSCIRAANGADKEEYLKYLKHETVWLHAVSKRAYLKGTDSVGGLSDLLKDFKGKVRG